MMNELNNPIIVSTTIDAPIEKVWHLWNSPEHIMQWYAASDDWHAPHAESEMKIGGRSKITMAAKDGSFSFDLEWTYTQIKPMSELAFSLDDDRKVTVVFSTDGKTTHIVESFEAESMNSRELQAAGWQSILNNFKKHVESQE